MKILPIKPQKNCCASPIKTQYVLDLKQHCTDCSVCDIKVPREQVDSIFDILVLMSNKSCFLLKQCCCCKVIKLQWCCWVLKRVWLFSSLSLCIYRISLSTLFKCGWMATHTCVPELCEITAILLLWGWVGVLNNTIVLFCFVFFPIGF